MAFNKEAIMRKIKFRGKAIEDYPERNIKKGDWVYGYFIRASNECGIAVTEGLDYIFGGVTVTKVDCETVGQYAGFKDKNNKEIYRGDVVICVEMHDSNIFTAWESNGHPNPIAIPFIIEKDKDGVDWIYPLDLREHPDWWKVVGNIYDNPELKGDKE